MKKLTDRTRAYLAARRIAKEIVLAGGCKACAAAFVRRYWPIRVSFPEEMPAPEWLIEHVGKLDTTSISYKRQQHKMNRLYK